MIFALLGARLRWGLENPSVLPQLYKRNKVVNIYAGSGTTDQAPECKKPTGWIPPLALRRAGRWVHFGGDWKAHWGHIL